MGSETRLPWSQTLQDNFLKLLLKAPDFIPNDMFKWKIEKDKKKFQLNKKIFRRFIQNRGWSNLLTHTQEEIIECLKEIDELASLPEASVCVWFITVEKIQ